MIALNNLATVTENETDIEALLLRALKVDPGHVNSLFNLADLYRYEKVGGLRYLAIFNCIRIWAR